MRIIPWHQLGLATINLVFDMLKLSIEALVLHQSRPSCQIDVHLLTRLVQAGLNYPVFSPQQKELLQQSAVHGRPAGHESLIRACRQ